MSQPLFAYGTLMDADILRAVLGRLPPPSDCTPATAAHYRALYYPGRVYPALVPKVGSRAPGLLVHNLGPGDWQSLDRFEGDEYRRAPLVVTTAAGDILAQVYLPSRAIPSDAAPWTLDTWQSRHKAEVLPAETALARSARRR